MGERKAWGRKPSALKKKADIQKVGAVQKFVIAGRYPNTAVWFINTETQDRIRVEASDIVTNLPSELMIVIPKLAKGTYLIEVVTQYGGTTPLEEPRTAIFDKPLTVN